MSVLYRKYRPQTFAEVVGQKHIVKTLQNQLGMGMLAHAYLFTGSRGVGKTSIARILAKAVNCLSQVKGEELNGASKDACGECAVCKAVETGNFVDLVEIDAASNTGVDNIREMIEHTRFAPALGKYKVFIIDEVHMLSKGAFNALLKTLEEPPSHAIFILATTEISKLPSTIVSRTQRFDFFLLPDEQILSHLQEILKKENISIEAGVLEAVTQRSEGGLRDALSLLGKVLSLGSGATLEQCRLLLGLSDEAVFDRLFEYVAKGQVEELPDFFSEIAAQGVDFGVFNRDFLEYLRKILVFKVAGRDSTLKLQVQNITEKVALGDIIYISRLFIKSYKDAEISEDPQLPLLLSAIEGALKFKGKESSGVKQAPHITISSAVSTEKKFEVSEKKVEIQDTQNQNVYTERSYEFSLEEVKSFWPAALDKVRAVNGPLANLVRTSELLEVTGGQAVLGVKFAFHKQSIENPKNNEILKKAILDASGKPLGVAARVQKEQEERSESSPSEVIAEALKVFGGEVVE